MATSPAVAPTWPGGRRLSAASADTQRSAGYGAATVVSSWKEGRAALSTDVDNEIGREFVGYRLDEVVGHGGMGVVYRAFDRRLKRTVALKFVAPELAEDDRFRERFLRETQLALSFEHPNVVPVYDAGEVDGRLYLAMRYVEGSDLATLLRSEAPLEPARALAICGHVGRALDAAHAAGLVHRDVKPSNVLLGPEDHVYLADFGLTRRLADSASPPLDRRSLGTAAYVAPEQIEGGPVDGRADQYSLACVLYECLTGEPPFRRESRLAVVWAHLEEEPPAASERNPTLPGTVDAAIRTSLDKDPDHRQPSCGALVAATESALGLRVHARPRRTLLVAGAAAVLAALVAAGAALVASSRTGRGPDPPLYGDAGSVVRIDPHTTEVTDVVHVAGDPEAVTVRGHRVWVYDYYGDTISSVDERTKQLRTTSVGARAVDVSSYAGPVLAADDGGAWLIGTNYANRPVLMRITPAGRLRVIYLDREPLGVAVGYGALWVAVQGDQDSQLLRIDPATGSITHRTRFTGPASVDSVAAGLGYVWAVASSSNTLYRLDARTGERRGQVAAGGGTRAPRPYLMRGYVWVGLTVLDPRTLQTVIELGCCSADDGEDTGGFGSVWTSNAPTGSVIRWGSDWGVEKTLRVVGEAPAFGGGCLTSIAAGAGSIWVTVASSHGYPCGP